MDQFNKQNGQGPRKTGLVDKIGEAVERIGTAVGQAVPNIGKKIHDAGDRLEKSHRNPNHPDDGSI